MTVRGGVFGAAAWIVAAMAASPVARAGLLDVAFYNSGFGGTQPAGPAVLGSAGDQWNWIDAANCPACPGPVGLVDTSGVLTAATMTLVAGGSVVSATTGTQPVPDLTDNYLFDNTGGSIVVALNGLAAGAEYHLVLYVASDDAAGGNRALTGSVAGQAVTPFAATGDPQSAFVDGLNVVVLDVVADVSGGLTIVESNPGNGSGEVDFNGLQIQSVPEPGGMMLVGVGLVLVGVRGRRESKKLATDAHGWTRIRSC